jgi:predicted O-methyltransferase YrrM
MTEEQIKHITDLVNKTTKRAPSFAMMLNHLIPIHEPLVVETGCARQENNFEGDGMSTTIFDTFIDYHGGEFYSVDINPDNVRFATAMVKKANLTCSDSVKFLHNQSKVWVTQNRKIDLLYLDSFDFDLNNCHPSSLHHIFELTAIMPCLREGTMVCVDDNPECVDANGNPIDAGKGLYIKQFMDLIGKERIYTGYQWVWKL